MDHDTSLLPACSSIQELQRICTAVILLWMQSLCASSSLVWEKAHFESWDWLVVTKSFAPVVLPWVWLLGRWFENQLKLLTSVAQPDWLRRCGIVLAKSHLTLQMWYARSLGRISQSVSNDWIVLWTRKAL
jgi:hypothetical protein